MSNTELELTSQRESELLELGIDRVKYEVIVNQFFPNIKDYDAIRLAIQYCVQMDMDIMKRPVHIIGVKDRDTGKTNYTIWLSIDCLRIMAHRTKEYLGIDKPIFGETIEKIFKKSKFGGGTEDIKLAYPESCEITVYRLVRDQKIAFTSIVFWEEEFKESYNAPNSMWSKAPRRQLAKVAEAAALRKAFPESLSGKYIEEEAPSTEQQPVGKKSKTSAFNNINNSQQSKTGDDEKTIEGASLRLASDEIVNEMIDRIKSLPSIKEIVAYKDGMKSLYSFNAEQSDLIIASIKQRKEDLKTVKAT